MSSKESDERYTTPDLTARRGDDTAFKDEDLMETGDDGDGAEKCVRIHDHQAHVKHKNIPLFQPSPLPSPRVAKENPYGLIEPAAV